MKKVLVLIVFVLVMNAFCINTVAAEGASVTLACDDAVFRGNTLLVIVSLDELQGVSALAVEPVFASNAFSLVAGEWKINGALSDFDAGEGNGVLAFSSATTVNGEILSFELAVAEDALLEEQNINCNIVVVYGDGTRENLTVNPVAVAIKCDHSYGYEGLVCTLCGAEREVTLLLGDVNFDGYVDNLDAVFIIRYDVSIINLMDKALLVADVNNDGCVDTLDAAFVLRYDAGLINSFE